MEQIRIADPVLWRDCEDILQCLEDRKPLHNAVVNRMATVIAEALETGRYPEAVSPEQLGAVVRSLLARPAVCEDNPMAFRKRFVDGMNAALRPLPPEIPRYIAMELAHALRYKVYPKAYSPETLGQLVTRLIEMKDVIPEEPADFRRRFMTGFNDVIA